MTDPDVPEYTGCSDTETPWGQVCQTCGQRLPKKPGPLTSEQAKKEEQRGRERWSVVTRTGLR